MIAALPPCVRTDLGSVRPAEGSRWPPGLHHGSLAGTSLRTPVPFLAQEVFEVVHELLRVHVVVTPWARRRGPRRVIGLLQLPDIGLDAGVLRDGLVTLAPKRPHGRLKGRHIELQVEQGGERGQQRATHGRIGGVPEVMRRWPHAA